MAELIMQEEASTPSTPTSGKWKVYFKASGLYVKDDAGNEYGPLDSSNVLLTTDGTSTAYTITTLPATALITGETFRVKFHATAGATPTLNRDALGAKSLKYYDATGTKQAATSSQIIANMILTILYDGTDYVILGGGSSGGSSGGGGDTIRTKYIITPSVASNNLTIALKYINGTDPSSTNKLTFRIGNTEYDLTASMSFTKNAGTNWCNAGSAELATKNVQFFLYAIGETGGSAGLKFGFSRIPYARTMADFVNTSTDPRYIAGNWTNFNSTDAVTLIGRFQAQNSGTASYNWSIPTANVVNYPIYETDILSWTPSYSGSGSLTYTSVTTLIANYQIVGRYCIATISTSAGTTGGTTSTTIFITAPISSLGSTLAYPLPGLVRDATSGTIPPGGGGFDETQQKLYAIKIDASNYGLGTGRRFSISGSYPIA